MDNKSNKEQGEHSYSTAVAEDMQIRQPQLKDRGMGSAYANALTNILNSAKSTKEQGKEFSNPNLGTFSPKDLKEFSKSHQPEGFDHKKKLTEE